MRRKWLRTPMGVSDLQTGQHSFIAMGTANQRWTIWSRDSNAALILDQGHYGGVGGVWHITNFADDVGQIQTILLMNYMAGSQAYVDISADGERVLLRHQSESLETGLYLWD